MPIVTPSSSRDGGLICDMRFLLIGKLAEGLIRYGGTLRLNLWAASAGATPSYAPNA